MGRLERLIIEDNVEELPNILNSNELLRNNFNIFRYSPPTNIKCSIRGAEALFSIIERTVPHHRLLHNSKYKLNIFDIACKYNGRNAFDIACKENNIFIVKECTRYWKLTT